MIAPSNLFSFLTKTLSSITEGFRAFVAGSIIGVYGLILYEAFPELLFDLNNSIFYFVMPVSAIASVLIGLPRLAAKSATSAPTKQAESDPLLEQIIGDDTAVQAVANDQENTDISKIGGSNPELDALLAGGADPSSDTITAEPTQVAAAPGFDENAIREMIDEKFEPVEKDLTTFKKDLNKIKEDMKVTKESVDTLTESFEGTLTDMKAFQAEISNPLNFMRKYFEALDLSNLSDPSLPLRQGIIQTQNIAAQNNQSQTVPAQSQPKNIPMPVIIQASSGGMQNQMPPPPPPAMPQPAIPQPQAPPAAVIRGSEMDNLVRGTDFDNPISSVMQPLFSGSLSVANMMAIIELVGEMFQEKGDDCIDLLMEQCKLMGLKPEDESTIYNIIDMLKNSNMSVDESISQLYKFAKIVGLNDKEADAYYARLSAQKKSARGGD